eukprot:COSAG02_NODE_6421_length_3582_cov_14.646282_1_plen_50_part_10
MRMALSYRQLMWTDEVLRLPSVIHDRKCFLSHSVSQRTNMTSHTRSNYLV